MRPSQKEIFEMLTPLYDVYNGVELLLEENAELRKENKYLKERLEQYEKSLKDNAKASGEAMSHFIHACLDGRIRVEGNRTVINHEDS